MNEEKVRNLQEIWYDHSMKIGCILVAYIYFFLLLPHTVQAHIPGQEPFFKINTIYTPLYPVFSTSREDFILPQDIAPEVYEINSSISFEIDTKKLPMISESGLKKMKFIWDFGDTTKGEGTMIQHTYEKIGSYIVTVYADDSLSSPVLFQSTLLHIVPNKDYILPKSVITVNGKNSHDPLSLFFDDEIIFDATSSSAGSSRIQTYYWDFGDMKKSTKSKEIYRYIDDLRIVFPLLRVTDENGFISDTFVQINNKMYDNMSEEKKQMNFLYNGKYYVWFGLGSIIAFLLFMGFVKAKKN